MIRGLLSKIRDYVVGSDVFSQDLIIFKTHVNKNIEDYARSNAIELDPGSINVPLETLITSFRRQVESAEIEFQKGIKSSSNLVKNEIYLREKLIFEGEASEALESAYKHLISKLNSIGEGYSLLKRTGSENTLKDLGLNPLDYIDNKIEKMRELIRKGARSGYAFGYHIAEIFLVANDFGIEVSGIKGLREVTAEYLKITGYLQSEINIRNFISRMQKKASEGKLNPYDSIMYKG